MQIKVKRKVLAAAVCMRARDNYFASLGEMASMCGVAYTDSRLHAVVRARLEKPGKQMKNKSKC